MASGYSCDSCPTVVRTICTACKEPYTPPVFEIRRLGFPVDLSQIELYHGAGCDNCNQTGYQGRLGVYELLQTTDKIREMIMRGESATAIHREARLSGMATMREDAWRKATMGITTAEEVNKRTRIDEPLRKPAVAV